MNDKNLTAQSGNRPVLRGSEKFSLPAVDIFETEDVLTLVADVPGARKDGLDIDLNHGILTIKAHVAAADESRLISREFSLTNYFRQFQLPNEFDGEKASAELKNGVLRIILPKSETSKPRRIAISH